MRVLTASEMAAVDRAAIEELGIPGLVLMENAALGVVEAVARCAPRATAVAVLCGPGNNGGDGLAITRHLEARGYRCRTFLVTKGGRPKGDAGVQLDILDRAGIEVTAVGPEDSLEPLLAACRSADLVVDALFGTGLSRPLEGHFAALVSAVDALDVPCLAVDLPSGLDGSEAEIPGPFLHAAWTVTFATPKIAHVVSPAADAVGEVIVSDLGIPPALIEEAPGALHLLTAEELAAYLLPRAASSHKGTYGHVLVVAGGPGSSGAAVLAARAAVRGGAGLVTVGVPAPLLATVDAGSLESMTLALPATANGALGAAAAALAAAEGKAAAAIGPGLGSEPETVEAIHRLVEALTMPLVIDADGLNAYAGALASLASRSARTVLTPHPGELGRLLGITAGQVQEDRWGSARRAAAESGAVVVLKGHQTVIAEPEGTLTLNPTGNPGMASGGSGDVLTGLIAALLGQGYDAPVAAQLGVFLHGLAGDLAVAAGIAPEALCASDLIAHLGAAFAQLRAA